MTDRREDLRAFFDVRNPMEVGRNPSQRGGRTGNRSEARGDERWDANPPMRQGTATTSAPDRLDSTPIRQGRRKGPRDVRPARHPVPRQVNPPADDRRAWFIDGPATGRSMSPSRSASAGRTGTSRCPSTTTLERAPHEGGGSRVRPRGCNLRSPSLRSRLHPRVRISTKGRPASATSSV